MHFQRIKHPLASDDDLLRLLLDRERSDEGGNFLGSFPLGKLRQTLLAGPDAGVDDFQKQLASPGVEYENGTIDRLKSERKGIGNGESRTPC